MTAAPNHREFALPAPRQRLVDPGFSVFPVELRSKHPLGKWKAYQTERGPLETLRQWASRPSNIGIATGRVSGLIVDLDTAEAVAEAERRGIPHTPTVRTAKGLPVYLRHPGGTIRNRAGLLPGCDIRGNGGYVVAPSSIHPT